MEVGRTTKCEQIRACRDSALVLCLFAILCGAAGCQSTPSIQSTDLPPSFRAAHRTPKPQIDLSVLAQKSINSDLVYPGDELDVLIVSGAEETQPEPIPCHVYESGEVELPFNIGVVPVAGLTLTGVEQQIRRASIQRQIFRNPVVSVVLRERQTDNVRVLGAVETPGDYKLPRAGSDLLAAISAAGGLSEEAGTKIEVLHPVVGQGGVLQASYEEGGGTQNSVHVDLLDAMKGQAGDLTLRDGSVVMVKPHVPQTIYVHGLVPNDGEFELPKDEPLRVTQAIALAGGREIEVADTVHVTRFVEGREEPVVAEVSLKEAKSNRDANLVLQAGDVVSVEETPTTFTVDFLRNFFRIGFSSAIPGF